MNQQAAPWMDMDAEYIRRRTNGWEVRLNEKSANPTGSRTRARERSRETTATRRKKARVTTRKPPVANRERRLSASATGLLFQPTSGARAAKEGE